MKISVTLCASVLALATLALTVDGAFAATNLNSSKSNVYKLDPNDPNAAKACTDKGGIVSTGAGGQKTCTTPSAACSATNISAGTSSSLDTNDAAAVKACFDACGTISTDQAGQTICTKPGTIAPATAPTTAREPNN